MTFIIAVVILLLLCIPFVGLRAYMSFSLLIMGLCSFVTGIGGEEMLLYLGLAGIVIAFAMAYLSVRHVERSRRVRQMFRFFVYGFLLFVKVLLLMLVITIPLAKMMSSLMKSYEEITVVDSFGNKIGTDFVDKNLRSPDGKQYHYKDPY